MISNLYHFQNKNYLKINLYVGNKTSMPISNFEMQYCGNNGFFYSFIKTKIIVN